MGKSRPREGAEGLELARAGGTPARWDSASRARQRGWEERSVRLTELDQPPMVVRLFTEEGVVVKHRAWLRLKRRVFEMPQTSTAWLTVASLLAGTTLAERDSWIAVATGLGAIGCYLAHRAVNRANRGAREDIIKEMELHET